MLLLIIVLLLLFGGGASYYGYSRWGPVRNGMTSIATILLILVILFLVGAMR